MFSGGAVPQRAQPAQHPENPREDADGEQESVPAAERPPSAGVLSLLLSFLQPPRTTGPSSEASTPPPRPTPRPSAGQPSSAALAAWFAACLTGCVLAVFCVTLWIKLLRSSLCWRRGESVGLLSQLLCLQPAGVFTVVMVTAAKMAGVYSDSDPPRKTMRRGVLMTLLQQSAMTLPLWIGKPGER